MLDIKFLKNPGYGIYSQLRVQASRPITRKRTGRSTLGTPAGKMFEQAEAKIPGMHRRVPVVAFSPARQGIVLAMDVQHAAVLPPASVMHGVETNTDEAVFFVNPYQYVGMELMHVGCICKQ